MKLFIVSILCCCLLAGCALFEFAYFCAKTDPHHSGPFCPVVDNRE